MGGSSAVETVLVTIDGSEESMAAVEYAVAIAARYDAAVHVMYVLGDDAARAIEDGDDAELAAESEAALEAVRATADRESVPVSHSTSYGFSTRRLLVHPGSVILDAAEQMDADFVVVPRTDDVDGTGVLAKAAEYVLLYASQPVLSV